MESFVRELIGRDMLYVCVGDYSISNTTSHDASRRPGEGASATLGSALVAVIFVGAALRLWQYAANTSLWTDEIALAKGVLALDLRDLLTKPLPYNQVAPKGFLLVQKLLVGALGSSDYALRLFPLACSLISLGVFGRLAMRALEGVGPLAAVTLFATAAPLIDSGALVKQYSTDVCVAVLLWWLAHTLASRPVTLYRAIRAALLGSTLVWFSHPGVLMIAALGATLAAWPPPGDPTKTAPRLALVPVLACWGASSLVALMVAFGSTEPGTREYLRHFWAGGFAPLSPWRYLHTFWPLDQLRALFGRGPGLTCLGYPLPVVYIVLTAVGFAVLWRRHRRTGALLLAPLVFALAAAVIRQYPFSDRLILFLVPGFMLAIAAAVEGVRRLLWPVSRPLGVLATIAILLPAVYPVAAKPPAYYTEHMKPVLSYVRDRRQQGDGIYVYYGAAPAITFYDLLYGLGRGEYAVGGCHRGDSRRYLRELDTFRGRSRVWVLLTHASPRYLEREDILAYLDTIGLRKDSVVVESRGVGQSLRPAEAYLYDLSNDRKLADGDADSFRLQGPPFDGPRTGCGVGPQAMVRADFR